jgi:hypothetical protein
MEIPKLTPENFLKIVRENIDPDILYEHIKMDFFKSTFKHDYFRIIIKVYYGIDFYNRLMNDKTFY